MNIKIDPAPETPLDKRPRCLRSCGTKHRGCDPQCPKRWHEQGERDERRRWVACFWRDTFGKWAVNLTKAIVLLDGEA